MDLDLDALQQADDTLPPFIFQFGGEEYSIDAEVDVEVWEYLRNGAFQQALLVLLGEEQYGQLKESEAKFTDKHMKALLDGVCAHIGIDLGKSRGRSTRSQRILLK